MKNFIYKVLKKIKKSNIVVNQEILLQDFKKSYASKYNFPNDEPLGEGSYGAVFKADDIDRGIPVAIKIYHDGITPTGSERGWLVTSKIINSQISPTYTIETFTASDGKECKAVISRFIPGLSLKKVFEKSEKQTEADRLLIADDFVFTFLPSLLNILELCHSLGFGHGDLTSGNIMVTLTNIHEKYEFLATLIDFDNSSIETEVFCATEKEKIDKDCRAFKNLAIGIGPYLVMDWKWGKEVQNIFTSYNTIREFRIAFKAITDYVNLVNQSIVTKEKVFEIFQFLFMNSLNRFSAKPTIDSLRNISIKAGIGGEFDQNHNLFMDYTKRTDSLEVEVTITEFGSAKNAIYGRIFN